MRKLLVVLLLLLAAALPSRAQVPYLVKDINTTNAEDRKASSPTGFVEHGGRVYFIATTDDTGTELWVFGGDGATLVADLVPGGGSSNPSGLMVVGGRLLFTATDAVYGSELRVTDGTPAGTSVLIDINPGAASAFAGMKVLFGNRMIFSADDGVTGRDLWSTDGTAAGTHKLKDIPATPSTGPTNLTVMGNAVYFSAAGGLWKTDGTEAGTFRVAAVPARNLTAAGSRLFFEGFTAAENWEPWVSDGTEAGTHLVKAIVPGPQSPVISNFAGGFTAFGERVLFLASDDVHGRELWISDGTADGTAMVRDFIPGPAGAWDVDYAYMAAYGGRVYFSGFDEEHGYELWVTDGTDAGTALFADLKPGPEHSHPMSLTVSGGKLFVAADHSIYGTRLWVTDGTPGGTRVVDMPGNGRYAQGGLTPVGGKVYFAGTTLLTGTEPWVSDGTNAGTRMLANVATEGAPSSNPHLLTAAGGLLFFHAIEGPLSPETNAAEASLWRSDGTAAGTFKLRETGQHPAPLTPAGPFVLFPDSINSSAMFISDGTVQGTMPADAFLARFGGWPVKSFFPFGDVLFAGVEDRGIYDESLWKWTAEPGASPIRLGGHNPSGVIESAGHYFFYTRTEASIHGRALWRTDGTPGGTHAVVPDLGGDFDAISPLVNAAGTIYFFTGTTLWKSDGTLDGTVAVTDVPSADIHRGVHTVAAGRRVYFIAGDMLWTSDGTAAGTISLTDVSQTPWFYRHSSQFAASGGRLVFAQRTAAEQWEVWSSDGTPEGTRLLAQLDDRYAAVTSIDGLVYFPGIDAQHGAEPWITDGTPEGTRMLFDLNPGAAGSHPAEFTKAGDTIYFRAATATTGNELWALPLTEPRLTAGDARAAEGNVMRFTVSLAAAVPVPVTAGYTTEDATATAGQDYEAASGTLTFAPGETTKTVDVRLLGDGTLENEEKFFLVLRETGTLRVAKGEGVGIIADDDQLADLGIAVVFNSSDLDDALLVSNSGPSGATDIVVSTTYAPDFGSTRCKPCRIPQLAPGASVETGEDYWPPFEQAYLSATVTARQPDPQPSNNTVTWTMGAHRAIVMTPAWLTPGTNGTVTAYINSGTPAVTSSDPTVVAVPSTLPPVTNQRVTFSVAALKPGTATLTIASPPSLQRTLLVTVAAAGETLRWPGAVTFDTDYDVRRIDSPLTVTVNPTGGVPGSGAKATGTVVVTANGQELARRTIGGAAPTSFPVWFRSTGLVTFTMSYSGDANFFPQSMEESVFVDAGVVGIDGSFSADARSLSVEVTGSPVVLPTGRVTVSHNGTILGSGDLQPGDGKATAQVALPELPSATTLTIAYSGDALYQSGSQEVRTRGNARRRSIRH